MRKSFFASALTAGLIAGTLDITAACIHAYIRNGTTPVQVLKGVASGAVDPTTFSSGTLLAILGLIVHFIIALSFTFFFFFLAKQIHSLVKYPVPVAILYGIFVWSAMRYLILPYLSRITPKAIVGQEAIINAIIGAVILMVCIGLPNALLAKRYLKATI